MEKDKRGKRGDLEKENVRKMDRNGNREEQKKERQGKTVEREEIEKWERRKR
jgi:hypothetical protein